MFVQRNPLDELKRFVASRYPIVYIESWEEDRVQAALEKVAQKAFSQEISFTIWSETLKGQDLFELLDHFVEDGTTGLFMIKDFHWNLKDSALLKRKLRDVYHKTKSNFKTLFLVSPFVQIPEDMMKQVISYPFPLPGEAEYQQIFQTTQKSFSKVKDSLNDEQRGRLFKAAQGLTLDEARLAFQKMFVGRQEINEHALDMIFEEKSRIIKREGLLEFVPTKYKLDDIGGLENLKEWLHDRSRFFSQEARDAGLQMPKGLLMTGISGCGKSLCTQAIAAAWGLPLYRLDINRVYGGSTGTAEEGFRRAIQQVESVAPAILWLEEIEKSVAGYQQGDRGVTARIFSSFLTWLQEHDSPVFVAATANEIDKLPPELLRKGRFDEIFFVDLPSEKERSEIFRVHLQKRQADMAGFNLTELAKASNDYNGAEIEQAVIAGLVNAFKDGKRKLKQEDIFRALGRTVPLATTMAESIKEIKRWADKRAVRASKA